MNLQIDESVLAELLPDEKQKEGFQNLIKSTAKFYKSQQA